MQTVLTLIDSERSARFPSLVRECARMIDAEPRWLSPDHAAEMIVDAPDDATHEGIAQLIRSARLPCLDHAITPAGPRRKRIVICDMDSTIIENECIDELAAHAGIGEAVAAITARTMAGELDFEQSLTERVALLAGLELSVFEEILASRIRIRPGARSFIATMREAGAFTALISGGFTQFTGDIREKVGFHLDRSNRLEFNGRTLTGKVLPPLLGPDAKRQALVEFCATHDVGPEDVMAVGDGANDIAMIRAAGLGVAFRAHPRVREAADVRLDHADLRAALYIQGFSDSEIVEVG